MAALKLEPFCGRSGHPRRRPLPLHGISGVVGGEPALGTRRNLVLQIPLDTFGLGVTEVDGAYDAVEILNWLDHAAVSTSDRAVLRSLVGGADARMLADTEGIPVQRVRERISRARRAGSADYHSSVLAA
jgi:hypothetical protein